MIRRVGPFVLLVVFGMLPLVPASAGAPTYQLTVGKDGMGGGTVTSDVQPGIECGQTCAAEFAAGTLVTLAADPNEQSTFVGWKGDCSGTASCQVTMNAAHGVRAVFARSHRPDEWIKLCGLSNGCVINPPPHPWRGRNIYNGGRHQHVRAALDNGEGVRFWIHVENDGAEADTIHVDGCRGTRYLVVHAVLMGTWKDTSWTAKKVTQQFKNDTLAWSFPPASEGKRKRFTLNIISRIAEGVHYSCKIRIWSESDPTRQDTVVAEMSTY